LFSVETIAEALASWRNGTHCGLFGTLCLKGYKLITTGGGGSLLSNAAELANVPATSPLRRSAPNPGPTSMPPFAGITGCPTSTPPWEWPN